MSVTAKFSLLCACGARVVFDDPMRGRVVTCGCGRMYRVPHRATAVGRAVGRLAWAWRWLIAGDHRPATDAARSAYREGSPRVMCPHCEAVPDGDAHWQCEFCWCAWNTFDTKGACPGCGFVFPATSCPKCHRFARHRDWYRPAALP